MAGTHRAGSPPKEPPPVPRGRHRADPPARTPRGRHRADKGAAGGSLDASPTQEGDFDTLSLPRIPREEPWKMDWDTLPLPRIPREKPGEMSGLVAEPNPLDPANKLLERIATDNNGTIAPNQHDWTLPGQAVAEPVQGLGSFPIERPGFTGYPIKPGPYLPPWVKAQLGRLADGTEPPRPGRYVDPHDPSLSWSQTIS